MGVGDYVACLQREHAEWQRSLPASRREEGLEKVRMRARQRRRNQKGSEGRRAWGHQFENRRRPWAPTTSGGSVDPAEVRRCERPLAPRVFATVTLETNARLLCTPPLGGCRKKAVPRA